MPESISYKSMSYTCEACGLDSVKVDLNPDFLNVSSVPYMCTLCHILLHENCLKMPRIIRIRQHPRHTIALTYCLGEQPRTQKQEDEQENEEKEEEEVEEEEDEEEEEYIDKQSCGICSVKMDLNHGGYRCGDCGFVFHTRCTERFIMMEKEDEPVVPSFIVIREVQLEEGQTIIEEMKHFSHDHNLISFEDVTQSQIGNNPKCECRALPIQTSFSSPPSCFGCPEPRCNFFMHKSCATLPRRKRILNKHMATLIKIHYVSQCDFCGEYCNGLVYGYRYQGYLCIQCFRLLQSDSMKHKGHRQVHGCHNSPIFLAFRRGNSSLDCIACGGHHETHYPFFTCASCNSSLDMKCAALPPKARPPDNKYDDHGLFLRCRPLKSDSYQSYCLICEEERDPKLWFYYCRLCDFSAHVECVLGKYPRIKFGGSYRFKHPHPLTLVELKKGKDHPSCHHCKSPDFDLAFKCTTIGCDYIMCVDCFLMSL